jgi:adenine-specific DNA-methyltransferase
VSHEKFAELDADRRIWWGIDGNNMPRLKRFLSEVKRGVVPQTIWTHDEVGHTQEAKKELLDLVHFEHTENVLDTVKPTRLIQRMLQIATKPAERDVVLDFFAGSAATGHAVLRQNREDGGNRRFICVQLPEPLPKPEKALRHIADIGKQRLRGAIERIRADAAQKLDLANREWPEDLGFKLFKLVESNFRRWKGVEEPSPDSYAEQMELHVDPLLPGWTPENVISEVALSEGYSLSATVEKLAELKTNAVYRVSDADKGQSFLLCLDDKLDGETPRALQLAEAGLFICRDVALTDEFAANLALQCNLKTI